MPHAYVNQRSVHFRIDGAEEAPWLVLCHALGTDLTLWDPQLEVLSKHFRLLRYDQRGHGRSAALAGEYGLVELAADLVSLLDVLEIERAHLCGVSIGGLVALQVAVTWPARVVRLVLANTAARIGTRENWNDRLQQVRSQGLLPLIEPALERWFTPSFRAREPATLDSFRETFRQTDAGSYAGCCTALRDADLRDALAAITAPCLVIAASDDPVTTPAHGRELARQLAGAHYVQLAAGHLSNVEAAADFNAAVLDFLV